MLSLLGEQVVLLESPWIRCGDLGTGGPGLGWVGLALCQSDSLSCDGHSYDLGGHSLRLSQNIGWLGLSSLRIEPI